MLPRIVGDDDRQVQPWAGIAGEGRGRLGPSCPRGVMTQALLIVLCAHCSFSGFGVVCLLLASYSHHRTRVQSMQPALFGDERRRQINLGGASGAYSQSALLNQAKVRRQERHALKQKQESAVKIQAWWRGVREAQYVRRDMRHALDRDITSLNALRCLVLVGKDEDALGKWSQSLDSAGEGAFAAYPWQDRC